MLARLVCLLLLSPSVAAPLTLHVAPGGHDAWSGRLAAANRSRSDGPLATLGGARDRLRAVRQAGGLPAGGAVVEVAAGVYEMLQPLALEAGDSGTAAAPIVWRVARGAAVRLVGGKVLGGWQPVRDRAVLDRLEPTARGQVLVCDLAAHGLPTLPLLAPGHTWAQSDPGNEFFFGDQPMTLARWPNVGFVKVGALHGPTPQDIRGTKGCMEGLFEYAGDRPGRWVGEPQVMLHGYWFWDWADQRLQVEQIDTARHILTLQAKPQHAFGFRTGQWYYAYNLLSELDQPGEWYADRAGGKLYFWPPRPIAQGAPRISVAPNLITLKDVHHTTFQGFILEAVKGTAISASGAEQVHVVGCTIRNTAAWAVNLSGRDSSVRGCDIYLTGEGGVNLNGGDRPTLTPGRLHVENCNIHHFSRVNPVYKPAVMLNGVGHVVRHNLLHNAPHMAIGFGGNDHLIEYNEIHSVVYESNDAGVMYAGYNPTMRGHQIRYNYLHHIYGYEGRGCVGVYLDDMFCSADIVGNLFYQVPRAAFIGGGRDNSIVNNTFVDCSPAVHIDARALGWAAPGVKNLETRLKEMPYTKEPWTTRWPQLLHYLDDEPAVPKGNLIARNICWGGKWDEIEGKARPHVKYEANLLDQDPRFVNASKLDFRLRPDSPALRLGFQPLPISKMGLYASTERASWPVRHTVRPGPARPPTPPKVARGDAPVVPVRRSTAAVKVDGELQPAEWDGLDAARAVVLEQGVGREKLGPASRVWLAHDGTVLRLAFDNPVRAGRAISTTATWGQDDAVELAVRVGPTPSSPIVVLRGFPNGTFVSSDEAGAPATLVKQAGSGVQFAAKVQSAERWTAELLVPWRSLGVTPTAGLKLAANLTVRKPGGDLWILWQGTGSFSWEANQAGLLQLAP
ncbi:MAG: right-handed parallel beta-helix repeat-containing protein [Fimbriimonadaceae bacterium]|nr:right-handed parallel beta-helix repeat-containing protein [Fimbriimonadaceae bacterium]